MLKKYVLFLVVFTWVIPQIDYLIYLDMFPNIRELARVESQFKTYAKNPKDTDVFHVLNRVFRDYHYNLRISSKAKEI